jgi:adenine-specific DNA-methyltransferase
MSRLNVRINMSRLTDLLRAARQLDPQLAKDLEDEIAPLQKRLPFGLNFERHAPEAVELPGHKIRKMSKVRVLPPRGTTARGDQRIWTVDGIEGEVADISTPNRGEIETASVPLDDLVLVAEFRDRIYPGLRPDGTVERGGDKPFHTVINGENFHVLEQLTFTHEHSVDAIYIDPPYNTGSRDWKYNNDYVEGDDLYRHSKWLAFLERRLKVAKRLLKPDDSVLIVTIDEKEYLRLGLLLEQIFPEADIQMVSDVINRAGSSRGKRFSRVDEYIFYVFLGDAGVEPWTSTMLGGDNDNDIAPMPTVWFTAIRRGSGSGREDKKSGKASFYPVVVDATSGAFIRVGDPVPHGVSRHGFVLDDGELAIWPLANDGRENRWRFSADVMRRYFENGTARLGKRDPLTGLRPVTYLQPGTIDNIANGTFEVLGRTAEGALELGLGTRAKAVAPRTVWNRKAHFARDHGSNLNGRLLPGRSFPFPKALYAVEDALRFIIADKPDAVVLDFFSGSGTTAHAVMRLNRQDGGRRLSISVTNNEVSSDEQGSLLMAGLRAGDAEWEQWGICDYITKPRIKAAITGTTPEGAPVDGDYTSTAPFPMADGFEENAAFFTLTYESPWMVSNDKAFAGIAPMLWLRAGAQGECIDSLSGGWAVADTYGILRDLDQATDFVLALRNVNGIRIAYIVTDDEGRYQQVADELRGIETVRLYEDYLRNCESTGDL